MKNIIIAIIVSASAIVATKIHSSALIEASKRSSNRATDAEKSPAIQIHTADAKEKQHGDENKNRYQMEIITDKGANWNGIYVLDTRTGLIRFYASSNNF